MTYVFKHLHELADFFRQRAEHEDRTADEQSTAKNRAYHQGERNAYLYAGEVVRDCVIQDVALMDEYRVAYAEAVNQLGHAMWNILKVAGVPTAVYALDQGWAKR